MLMQTAHLYPTFHDYDENAKASGPPAASLSLSEQGKGVGTGGGICVANHTSAIDAAVLNTKVVYCLTGQKHGGWLGTACTVSFAQCILRREGDGMDVQALSRVVPHLWFDRSRSSDRSAIKEQLRDHARNPDYPPTLIFPEGESHHPQSGGASEGAWVGLL